MFPFTRFQFGYFFYRHLLDFMGKWGCPSWQDVELLAAAASPEAGCVCVLVARAGGFRCSPKRSFGSGFWDHSGIIPTSVILLGISPSVWGVSHWEAISVVSQKWSFSTALLWFIRSTRSTLLPTNMATDRGPFKRKLIL